MITKPFSLFLESEFCPTRLADTGIEQGTIYYNVNKHLMTGLIAYTKPYFGVVVEQHFPLEQKVQAYLAGNDLAVLNLFGYDDTAILSESDSSLWFWWADYQHGAGSVGRLHKDVLTTMELQISLVQFLRRGKAKCLPTVNHPCLTGNYLVIEVVNKQVIF